MEGLENQVVGSEGVPPEVPVDDVSDVDVNEGIDTPVDDGIGAQAAEPPPYEPDFSFNVLDKKEEIPEEFRSYITDKETENRFRDVFERAYGVEPLKQDRQFLRDDNQRLNQENSQFKENYGLLGQMVKVNDLEGFHKQWGITEEQLVDHVMNKVRMADPELPQEQRQGFLNQQQERSQLAQLQYQNQQLLQNQQQASVMQRESELNSALAHPDVARTANEYDTRVGKPGAFREEIIRVGTYHGYNGRDISPNEAIQEFQQRIGVGVPTAMGMQQPQGQGQQVPQQVPVQQAKPVIPVPRGGGGQSPAATAPRSIADLRKLGKQMS